MHPSSAAMTTATAYLYDPADDSEQLVEATFETVGYRELDISAVRPVSADKTLGPDLLETLDAVQLDDLHGALVSGMEWISEAEMSRREMRAYRRGEI